MKLVVGLGNPGKKYGGTRHNVGFELIERLVAETAAIGPKTKFDGEIWNCVLEEEKLLLLMPQTFMNLSGSCVRKAIDFYQIPAAEVLVVCDDFHLPLGQVRLRSSGSDGGQNGLADVIRTMGSQEVPRLRIGIGPVPDRWNPADFVLGQFAVEERLEVSLQVARAADAVKVWAAEGMLPAMNRFNGKSN